MCVSLCVCVLGGGGANRAKTTTSRRFAHNTSKTPHNYTNMVRDAAFYCSSSVHRKKKCCSGILISRLWHIALLKHEGIVFKSAQQEAWASTVCHHINQQTTPSPLPPSPTLLRTRLLFSPLLWFDTFSGGVHLKGFLGFLDLERDAVMACVWRNKKQWAGINNHKVEAIISPEPWRHSPARTSQFNPNIVWIKSFKSWILLLVRCQVCNHQKGATLHSQYRCLMKGTLYRITST